MPAGRRDVPDLELERLEAAEDPAHEAGDDVDPVALVEQLAQVGALEGDAVEDVGVTSKDELGVAAGGCPDPGTVSPRMATSGSGLPGPYGASRARSRRRL